MQRTLLFLGLGYLAFVWQAALRPSCELWGVSPNFLAAMLVLSVWHLPATHGIIAAALLGLGADVWSGSGLGADMLAYTVTGLLLQGVCPPHWIRHWGGHLSLVAGVTAVCELGGILVRCLSKPRSLPLMWDNPLATLSELLTRVCGDGLITAALFGGVWLIGYLCWGRFHTGGESSRSAMSLSNRWGRLTEL